MRIQVFDYAGSFKRAYNSSTLPARCCPYGNLGLGVVGASVAAYRWFGTANNVLPCPSLLLPPVCDDASSDSNADAVFLLAIGAQVGSSLATATVAAGWVEKRNYSTGNLLAAAVNGNEIDFLPWGVSASAAGWVNTDLDYDPANQRLAVLQCLGAEGAGSTGNTSCVFVYDGNLNLLTRFGVDVSALSANTVSGAAAGVPGYSTLGSFTLATAVMVNSTTQEIFVVDAGIVPNPYLCCSLSRDTIFASPDDSGYLNGAFSPATVSATVSVIDLAHSFTETVELRASIAASWCEVTPGSGSISLNDGVASATGITLTPRQGMAAPGTVGAGYSTVLTLDDLTHGQPQTYGIALLESTAPSPPPAAPATPLDAKMDAYGYRHVLFAAPTVVGHMLFQGDGIQVGETTQVARAAATGVQLSIQADGTLLANLDGVTPSHYSSHDCGHSWAVAACDSEGRLH